MTTNNKINNKKEIFMETIKEEKDLEENNLEPSIDKILLQTNYTYEEAKEKLIESNYDVIKVIKDYLNIEPKKNTKKTINQEIFNQFRKKFADVKRI